MLAVVTLLLLVAGVNPTSYCQGDGIRAAAALRIGDTHARSRIVLSPKETVRAHPESAELVSREDPESKPRLRAVISPSNSDSESWFPEPGRITGDGLGFMNLIAIAYQTPFHRVINEAPPIGDKYTVSVVAPKGREDLLYPAFQEAVASTFGVRVLRQTREMNVFVLRVSAATSLKLRPSRAETAQHWFVNGRMHAEKQPVAVLADVLENFLDRPVVDETGLEGEYDWDLPYRKADETAVVNSVRDDLGFEMVPARREVDVLVIDAASETKDDHWSLTYVYAHSLAKTRRSRSGISRPRR